MAIVIANTVTDLDKQLHEAGDKLVVIMFTSESCAACRNIDPKVTQVSREYGDRIVVVKVNVNGSNDLAHRYHIHLLPTFLFMRYGKNLDKFSGADSTMLNLKIKELLKQ